ncbi:ATP-binding protein [Microbacterium halophytorum]|uniref:ATP-binding protein n=1 Tax=Microbacterium halophytorum TaxID=2067568 RepID=UPI001E2F1749|nr:ATP-binding protein [Microbacterium halophytorum]
MLLLASCASALIVPTATVFVVAAIVLAAGLSVALLRVHVLALIVVHYAALGFYCVAAATPDDALVEALVPLTAFTIILPIMLLPGVLPIAVSCSLTLAYAALLAIAHPEWDRAVVSNSLATSGVLVVNAAVFIYALRRIARSFDRRKVIATAEEARAVRRRAAKDATAEYVRVLHDTIVNTFGALARGGDHGPTPADARARCRRDLERIRDFQRRTAAGRTSRVSLTDIERVGLPVRWKGIVGDDLRRFQALLPVPVLEALYGCASEVALNAVKHSGADHIVIDTRYVDDVLQVEISDDGSGFDRNRVTQRGVAESLFARGEAHGIAVALETEVGSGTTVRLSYPLSTGAGDTGTEGAARRARPLRRFTREVTIAWALHVSAISASLEVLGPRGGDPSAYATIGALLLFTGVVWLTTRDDRCLPKWLVGLAIVAVPALNWAALVSIGEGYDAPYFFQSLSLTVLPVLLHASSRTIAPFLVAAALQGVSMVPLGLVVLTGEDPDQLSRALLLEAPAAGLLAMWWLVFRKFRSLEAEADVSERRMERAMRDSAAHTAAIEVQMRWNASGLQGSFRLLRDIADGTVQPDDLEVRRRCGDEEAFLRQVSALSQATALMGRWFALALAEARRKQIRLELHAERAEVEDPADADALGHLILDCIDASAEDSTVNVTLLKRDDVVRMLIVGNRDGELAARAKDHVQDRLCVVTETLRDRVLVDVTLSGAVAVLN